MVADRKSYWSPKVAQSSSRLDEIQDLVFLSSCLTEVDLTRSKILSSCLLVLQKSTWRDPRSRLLVFSSYISRLDEIQDLVFLSLRLTEVDLTRSSILSFCLFVLQKSTWRDPRSCLFVFLTLFSRLLVFSGSCLFVFSSYRSRLDEIQDLVFLSSWLFFSSSRLVFSSSRPKLSRLLGALLSFRMFDTSQHNLEWYE